MSHYELPCKTDILREKTTVLRVPLCTGAA